MHEEAHYQIVVVGGGINGVGTAREAAAQGYETLLIEKNDFGHATSSQTSKMVHGGLRYLEKGHFKLVKESLRERKTLLRIAPHLVHPLKINVPVYQKSRLPPFMIRVGCKLYDWFAGSDNLESSRQLSPTEQQQLTKTLSPKGLRKIISYYDGQVLDSRLCLENALSAEDYGATVRNYTELQSVAKETGYYRLTLLDKRTGETYEVTTQFLVNVSGPWVPFLEEKITGRPCTTSLKYVRGIHFVIPRITEENGFLIMPDDGRVVFVLPWHNGTTLVGTTESEYDAEDFDVIPTSEEEETYLLECFNEYFPNHAIQRDEVLHVYSGVRSLLKSDTSLTQLSREYRIHKELGEGTGYIGVYGGKLTTYRSLSEKVLHAIQPHLIPRHASTWETTEDPLPGGMPRDSAQETSLEAQLKECQVSNDVIAHWKSLYGSQWVEIAAYALASEENREVLAQSTFLRAELCYQVACEKAYQLEDVIARRTKLTYHLTDAEKQTIQKALDALR